MNAQYVLAVFIFFIGEIAMSASHIHLHASEPFFLFEVDEQQMWTLVRYSNTTLRFNPSNKVEISFEIPPALNMISQARVLSADVVVREKIEGKNNNGVNYKLVFLKGWETSAYLMTSESAAIYVNNAIGEYPQYGLSGHKVLLQMRDSFMFLKPNKLTEAQIRKIILASTFKKYLLDAEEHFKLTKGLIIRSQPNMYVVSLKNMRGGPVFHILKNDLTVTHHNER